MRLLALLTTSALLLACAHTSMAQQADSEAVRAVAEAFHRRIRWKDYQSASSLLVPDRRAAFVAAREAKQDERDLTISDYELLELQMDPGADRAEVVSRVHWLRLPRLTEHSDTIVTELVRVGRGWLIARQSRGPFVPELEAPYAPPGPAEPTVAP